MRYIFLLIIAFLLTPNILNAQRLEAYQIYNKKGDSVRFGAMIKELADYDVVLFGEFHDNAINHWLELRTTKALYKKTGEQLILGAEMLERDEQNMVSRYLAGDIDFSRLAEELNLWKNFKTDYKPLLDYAKKHQITFIATNVPRIYAHIVAKQGIDSLETLPQAEKRFMADLPIPVTLQTPGYKKMKELMKEHAGTNIMQYIQAQALKDATMAASIINHREPDQLFLHFNGNYHSKAYGGIYWYLKKKKNLEIAVISVAKSDSSGLPLPSDFKPTEFNIVVPKDMTKTYP